ncbi:MAG: hypothetical protein WCT37_04390 [Patescibacteria group bacterium]
MSDNNRINKEKLIMSEQVFETGNWVTWRPNLSEGDIAIIKEHGPGPFRIVSVENIPVGKCSCGGFSDDANHEAYGGCPYAHLGYGPLKKSVGHSQFVNIELPGGTIDRFSGAWFVLTEPPATAEKPAEKTKSTEATA